LSEKIELTLRTEGCPYCKDNDLLKGVVSDTHREVHRLHYSDVLLNNPEIDNFEGWVTECNRCGIYFVNPRYKEKEFPLLYRHLSRKSGAETNIVKKVAAWPTKFAMGRWHSPTPLGRTCARFIGKLFDPVLHIPIPEQKIKAGNHILDVGCGDGFHLRCLNTTGAKLFATEIHPGYKKLLSAGPEKITFWIKEFTSIDWEREVGYESFDLILFQSVFYRLNNPKESLDVAFKLLKPGGTILRIEPFCPDLESLKIITRFNFPQGFTFVHDLNTYTARLGLFYPDAKFNWKLYYGRSNKTITGDEFNALNACFDIIARIGKTVLKKQPYFLRLDITKNNILHSEGE
jgi:SAM-dependent methyltransferase